MVEHFDLSGHGVEVARVLRNPSPAKLYEVAIEHERGSAISDRGALIAMSGEKTGRSPKDKRIVEHPDSAGDIWWGEVNIKLDEAVFQINRERAVDYLNTLNRLFVIDGFAGADERYRLKVRVICERAYHALFMHNMLIRPTAEELENFGKPDLVIYNAGRFPANSHTATLTSKTSIDLSFEHREMVILGTEYAGEMKKGVFTVMNYLMPKREVLSMHCSATAEHASACVSGDGDPPKNSGGDGGGDGSWKADRFPRQAGGYVPTPGVTLFFGLSGTGKTTLSADPKRQLVGDDEHCWTDQGVFNIEGGCYAKAVDLSAEAEPDIYNAIRFGTVLENVVYNELTRRVDYHDTSITANTRASYPIEFMATAKQPSMAGHPTNVIFLTCDAFGVLPPVSKLTLDQAMMHFINGYTAKIAGTEVGVTEPKATFSACFAAPFLVWPPAKYAELLAGRMKKHGAAAWLVNTGWTGGGYGQGHRIKLRHTRAIIDAIHSGALAKGAFEAEPHFGLAIPRVCPDVPAEILNPRKTWADGSAYDRAAKHLAGLFEENWKKFA